MSRPIELPLSYVEATCLIAALRVTKDLLGADSAAILTDIAGRATDLLKREKTKGL